MTTLTVHPGGVAALTLEFYDDTTQQPADPSSVQLDITYGTAVGLVADTAGPYFYDGATSSNPSAIWRTGQGVYQFNWQVPSNAAAGVYVANWTLAYQNANWPAFENFVVTGGAVPVGAVADIGYWTGGISGAGLDIEFGVTDADGITWLWQKLEGWDGPDVTGGMIQRTADQGAWPAPQFYQPRALTWTVMASAQTQALRDLARRKLSSAVPVSELATLRYDEPLPLQVQVRRSGKITETYPTLTDVVFTVGLICPDPRKYSTQVKSVTAVTAPGVGITWPLTYPLTFPAGSSQPALTVTNAGNFETRPLITIQGPITGPALVSTTTGQTVSWSSLALGANDILSVDFFNQQAFLNGSYRSADGSSWWWNLPGGPEGATTVINVDAASNPGATVTCYWRDSYL